MRRVIQVCAFLVVLTGTAQAATIPITTCGVSIPGGSRGVLQDDLVCPDSVQVVSLGTGAALDLNGHSITVTGLGSVVDVHSPGRHTVRGPGGLVNVTISCGVGFEYERSVKVQNVDIVSTEYGGIDCLDQDHYRENRISARDVSITGDDSAFGITGHDVKLSNVTIEGSTIAALLAVNVKGRRLTIVGNAGPAIFADRGYADLVTLVDSDIRDNGYGISSVRIKLKDTTVTGNGVPPDGWDLDSFEMPILRGTSSCDHSLNPPAGASWGICAND